MSKLDWLLVVGMAITSGVAMWYQVRYYRLVDDLIEALGSTEDN